MAKGNNRGPKNSTSNSSTWSDDAEAGQAKRAGLKYRLLLAIVLLAVICVYSNSFQNSFHFDDFHTVVDNPAVRSLHNLPRFFTDATQFSVLPANQTYRPIVTASLALDYALRHGYNVFWFHLSTLVWFLVLLVLLYFFYINLLGRVRPSDTNRWLALIITAWLGTHPVMAETVNYIIQRGDLYCTLGCVAALLIYARWSRLRRTGLYLLPFALAMLSKPTAAVFPLLLLLYMFYFEAAAQSTVRRWRTSLLASAPALGATAVLLWLQATMTPPSYTPTLLSGSDYRLTQPFVWLRYAGALFLPVHLNADTDVQPFTSWNTEAVIGLMFAIGLVATVLYASHRPKLYPIAFGVAWFLLTQLPTSLYALSEVENDHRMFFSFPGLMFAVVWALYLQYERLRDRNAKEVAWRSWVRNTATGATVCLLCAYAYGAHSRNAVWRSEETLWADDVLKSPHNGRGLMMYGSTKMEAGDAAGALDLFERALVYTPNYPDLEINLGVVNGLLAQRGDVMRASIAEEHFRRALALAPQSDLPHAFYGRWLLTQGRVEEAQAQLQTAIALNGRRPMNRGLLLQAYMQAGNTTRAKEFAEQTLQLLPGDPQALAVMQHASMSTGPSRDGYINASLASYRAGRYEQALEQARRALEIDPRSAAAWNNVGASYGAMRQWDKAMDAEQQALKYDSGLVVAQNNLRSYQAQRQTEGGPADSPPKTAAAWIDVSLGLYQSGRYQESLEAAHKALALDPRSPEAWNNVAASEQAMQHWDSAIAAAQKALDLRPDFQLARNNLAYALQQRALHAAR